MIKPYPCEELYDRVNLFFGSIIYEVKPEAKKRLVRDMLTNERYRHHLFVRQVVESVQRECMVVVSEITAKASKFASKHLSELLILADLTREERALIVLEGVMNKHPSVAQDILADADPLSYLKLLLDEHRKRGDWDRLNPYSAALLICTPQDELIELAKQKKRYACLLLETLKDDVFFEYTQVDDDPLDILPAPFLGIQPHSPASWR